MQLVYEQPREHNRKNHSILQCHLRHVSVAPKPLNCSPVDVVVAAVVVVVVANAPSLEHKETPATGWELSLSSAIGRSTSFASDQEPPTVSLLA